MPRPDKLLLSKWTAAHPQNKEKHFLVVGLVLPEPPASQIEYVELEAIYTRRSRTLRWRELLESGEWIAGWR